MTHAGLTPTTPLLAAASGVLAHLFIFRRGEWDVASPSIFVFYFSLFLGAAALSSYPDLDPGDIPWLELVRIGGCHAAGLYGSMLVYRGLLHRLSGYPGPFLARLSNFYITALSMKKMHLYEETQKLHAKYGDYVRVGMFKLSFRVIPLPSSNH